MPTQTSAPHLDKLLVLVKFLEILDGHGVVANVLRSIYVVCISEYTYRHLWTRNLRHLHCSRETLVSLRVVVLQADLKFYCFREVSLFCGASIEHFLYIVTYTVDPLRLACLQ